MAVGVMAALDKSRCCSQMATITDAITATTTITIGIIQVFDSRFLVFVCLFVLISILILLLFNKKTAKLMLYAITVVDADGASAF